MDGALAGRQLSRADLELVLRRAAELDRSDEGPEALDFALVEAAALEAGLSRASVCQALAELRVGTLVRAAGSRRRVLGPSSLEVRRLVPGPLDAVRAGVHCFLQEQLFDLRRDFGEVTRWERRDGLVPTLRRRFDVNHRLTLTTVPRIQVALAADQGDDGRRVMVNLVADVAEHRNAQGWLVAAGATAAAGVTGVTIASVGIDPLLLASLPVSAGLVGGSHRLAAAQYRQQVGRIETALAGFLDRLEHRPAIAAGRKGN